MAITALFIVAACGEDEDPVIPVADFSFSAQDYEVTFVNASKDAQTFAWNFGDGSTSTEVSPVHTYSEYKDYEVSLTVTSSDGNTDDVTKTVSVIDACDIWDGSEANNLIVGGQFEFCDDKYWTMVKSSQPEHVKYTFGYSDYNPNDGVDGALYIYPDNPTTSEDEATIFYQEIQATSGEYQLDALLKLKGEDKDNPTAAMTDYWIQFYIGKTKPVDGEDYNEGQTSGWFYGAWTGWAYVIPPTDGPLVHNMLVSNMANEEGKFNLDTDTYYFAIKVGKGGAGSFGEGIAIDKVSLKRIGDRNACFDWDGVQAGNLIKGGQMGECDDKYWNILPANLQEFPVQFGYSDYAPSTGDGKALYFNNPEATKNAAGVGTAGTIYQYIGELDAGTYNISAQVKQGGVDGGNHQFWWEMYVWTEEPVEGQEYQPKESDEEGALKVRPIAGYTHPGWGPRPDLGSGTATVAVDGEMQYGYNPYDLADADGNFTIAEKGHYFFTFKFGTWEGSFGEGIAIDNLSITPVP